MKVCWWYEWDDTMRLRVNDCLETTVTRYEMVEWWGPFVYLILNKIMPLVWLTMPVHDEPLRR